MKRILIVLSVLVLSMLACSVGSLGATPTAMPTYTPYPTYTPVPPTDTPAPTNTPAPTPTPTAKPLEEINKVLLDNNFVIMGRDDCGKDFNPCIEYWLQVPKILVTVSGKGFVAFTYGANDDLGPIKAKLDQVFSAAYPEEVSQWIFANMSPVPGVLREAQVGKYYLRSEYTNAQKQGDVDTITIIVAPLDGISLLG